MTKRCAECKYFVPEQLHPWTTQLALCTHENNSSLVDGSYRESPHMLRYSSASKACGETGRWWEQKSPPDAAASPDK